MNLVLWIALAFAVLGVALPVGAWLLPRSRPSNPDDWGAAVALLAVFIAFEAVAIVLGIVGLIVMAVS